MTGTVTRRELLRLVVGVGGAAALLAACQPKIVEVEKEVTKVVKEVVKETVIVLGTPQVVEKEVTRVIKETVVVERAVPEKAKITMWVYPFPEFACVQGPELDRFHEQVPTTEVEVIAKDNPWEALRPALAGGVAPDIYVTPGATQVAEVARAGYALALDPFVEEFNWHEMFVPWALDVGRVQNILYSLPDELETIPLFYNKTLVDQKGWQLPKTMDELFELCEQIEGEGIIPFGGQGGGSNRNNEWYFLMFTNHIAGPEKFYKALIGEIAWTDPAFEHSMDVMTDMLQRGWWMGDMGVFLATVHDEARSALANGDVVMLMEGTWLFSRMEEYFGPTPNEWGVVPFPSQTGAEVFTVGLGSTESINSTTKYPRACAEWLTFFFSPKVQARWYADCTLAPSAVKLTADDLAPMDSRIAQIWLKLAKACEVGNYGYTTWTFFPPKSSVYMYDEIEKVWLGEMTTKEYLAGLDKIFAEELKAGVVPPVPKR